MAGAEQSGHCGAAARREFRRRRHRPLPGSAGNDPWPGDHRPSSTARSLVLDTPSSSTTDHAARFVEASGIAARARSPQSFVGWAQSWLRTTGFDMIQVRHPDGPGGPSTRHSRSSDFRCRLRPFTSPTGQSSGGARSPSGGGGRLCTARRAVQGVGRRAH